VRQVIVLSVLLISCGCAARLSRLNDKQVSERLRTENKRVSRIQDPVARTLAYIKIADLLVDSVAKAAHKEDMETVESLLYEYTKAIQSAQKTIVSSGHDPAEEPEGFTDLELRLREETRRLHDISRSLTLADRKPVDLALGKAVSIREELLRLIFPQTVSSSQF
jgi:hypothetical protein